MGKTFAKKENATQNLTSSAAQAAKPTAWAALLLLKGEARQSTQQQNIFFVCVSEALIDVETQLLIFISFGARNNNNISNSSVGSGKLCKVNVAYICVTCGRVR